MSSPDLTIVIPTLNEEQTLPLLLADLERQQGISCEVIVIDGGSTDATCQLANLAFDSGRLHGFCRTGPRGRGRQLNAGAVAAQAEWLLFLHADSRLHDVNLLHTALEFMRGHQQRLTSDTLAGHFALRFDDPGEGTGNGLYFYEVKASLGRPWCIHGDQGLLLPRDNGCCCPGRL
jgi:glycosyltransferase involved in cell wall biosynthesis